LLARSFVRPTASRYRLTFWASFARRKELSVPVAHAKDRAHFKSFKSVSNEFYSVRRNLAGSGGVNTWLRSPTAPLRLGAGSWLNHALCGRYFLKNWRGQADFLACRDRDVPPPLPVLHRPLPIGFVGSDDPVLASYLRIEERELEAGDRN